LGALDKLVAELEKLQAQLDTYEILIEYSLWALDKTCEMLPENICIPSVVIAGFGVGGCFFNILKPICNVAAMAVNMANEVIHLALEHSIAILSIFVAEEDPFDYPEATYADMTAFNEWTAEALNSINDVMQVQHNSMRQHLQDRHFSMESSVFIKLL
jgi:hypothetical protein